ncbi:zinc ribbon domain-containing protein [Halosaccharopolyspora lacisalsi]|uniref:zinc ribbon domain-containing protein n=1 Tax=Halosaccharopolyspora lacisalsi TaxID=1000566 RepID=UPI0038B3D2AC
MVIDRWLPASRTCSACGRVGGRKSLNVRTWQCRCGAVHDRDTNAAKNTSPRGACGGAERPWRRGEAPHRGGCRRSRKQVRPREVAALRTRYEPRAESPPLTTGSTSTVRVLLGAGGRPRSSFPLPSAGVFSVRSVGRVAPHPFGLFARCCHEQPYAFASRTGQRETWRST